MLDNRVHTPNCPCVRHHKKEDALPVNNTVLKARLARSQWLYYQGVIRDFLDERGMSVTPEQYLLLITLQGSKLPVDQSRLCGMFRSDKGNMSRMISRLCAAGLVSNVDIKGNRRSKNLVITDLGLQTLKRGE